jgi:hypothetical protein
MLEGRRRRRGRSDYVAFEGMQCFVVMYYYYFVSSDNKWL